MNKKTTCFWGCKIYIFRACPTWNLAENQEEEEDAVNKDISRLMKSWHLKKQKEKNTPFYITPVFFFFSLKPVLLSSVVSISALLHSQDEKLEGQKDEERAGEEEKREIFQLAAVWTRGSSSMTKKYIHRQSVNFAPYLSLPPWRAVSINNTWELGESIRGYPCGEESDVG